LKGTPVPKTQANPIKLDIPVKANGNGPLFVKCELSAEGKRKLAEWAETAEEQDMLKWLELMVTRGHTISVRSNEVGFQCSVTGSTEASGHHNKSLVARASTPLRALYSAWYRDQIVLQGVWTVVDRLTELDF
jgi:hypothetical protein